MNIKTTLKASVAAAALFAIAAPVATTADAADDTFKTGNKNSLTMSGYVSRAFYWADDGEHDGLFNTANETGQSRVRWIAKGTVNENVSMGALLELEMPKSNDDGSASFGSTTGDETTANNAAWNVRHQFIWVNHKTLGKISLGNTNAAANGGVQANFAKTGGTSGTMDNKWVGSGFQFLNKSTITGNATGSFTGVTVGGSRSDLDFTSRTDVLRYDTPKFGGARLAISYSQAGTGEVGATYGGKFGSVKVKARAGYSELSSAGTNDYNLGGSLAVLHDSGINAAVSGAKIERDASGIPAATNLHLAVGYNAKIFGAGTTGFQFTWNQSKNTTARGDNGEAFGFTAAQYIDSVGATIALSYRNYQYENELLSHRTIDDVDVFGLATVFNF